MTESVTNGSIVQGTTRESITDRDRLTAGRTIEAPAAKIFTLLADPARHHQTEPGDWVRDAIDPEPITGTGQVFGMNMFHPAGGDYVMSNRVVVFEKDRAIAWDPGMPDEQGNPQVGGWRWRYDLVPDGDGTEVTLTYDWSACPQVVRDAIGGLPPFGAEFLDESLAALERAVRDDHDPADHDPADHDPADHDRAVERERAAAQGRATVAGRHDRH